MHNSILLFVTYSDTLNKVLAKKYGIIFGHSEYFSYLCNVKRYSLNTQNYEQNS